MTVTKLPSQPNIHQQFVIMVPKQQPNRSKLIPIVMLVVKYVNVLECRF